MHKIQNGIDVGSNITRHKKSTAEKVAKSLKKEGSLYNMISIQDDNEFGVTWSDLHALTRKTDKLLVKLCLERGLKLTGDNVSDSVE